MATSFIDPVVLGMIGIAFGIATFIAAIAYMGGKLIDDERIKGWARLEVYEIIYSALIAVLLASAWTGMVAVNDQITKEIDPLGFVQCKEQSIPCYLETARGFMQEIYGEIGYLYVEFVETTSATKFLEEITYTVSSVALPVAGFLALTPCKIAYHPFNFLMDWTIDYMTKISIIVIFQAIFISFIAYVMPFFISVGFALRILGPTRKLGGLMMAIGLMLYFVYPMFYVFGGGVYHSLQADEDYGGMRISKFNFILGSLNLWGGTVDYDKSFDEYRERVKEGLTYSEVERSMGESEEQFKKVQKNFEKCSSSPSDIGTELLNLLKGILLVPVGLLELATSFLCVSRVAAHVWSYGLLSPLFSIPGAPDQYFISEVLFEILGTLLFFTTIFSFMAAMATIAGIKNLSVLLGGDVEIAGLTHFI